MTAHPVQRLSHGLRLLRVPALVGQRFFQSLLLGLCTVRVTLLHQEVQPNRDQNHSHLVRQPPNEKQQMAAPRTQPHVVALRSGRLTYRTHNINRAMACFYLSYSLRLYRRSAQWHEPHAVSDYLGSCRTYSSYVERRSLCRTSQPFVRQSSQSHDTDR